MFCIDSVDIHSIECIRDPCLLLTVATYKVFDGMVEKPSISDFQNFLRIENRLNIKKVTAEMCECVLYRLLSHIALNALHALIFISTVSTNNIAYTIQCIGCFDLLINSVDKQHSIHYSMYCML